MAEMRVLLRRMHDPRAASANQPTAAPLDDAAASSTPIDGNANQASGTSTSVDTTRGQAQQGRSSGFVRQLGPRDSRQSATEALISSFM